MKRFIIFFILFAIIMIGGFARFVRLNWDEGTNDLHFDETFISQYTQQIDFFDNMNPNFWGYHGGLFYLHKISTLLAAKFTNNPWWSDSLTGITLAGRYTSALFSTITIFVLYMVTATIKDKFAGLSAALLTSCSVFLIQSAHFHTTESYILLFESLLIYSTALYWKKTNFISIFCSALFFGLGITTSKNSMFIVGLLPVIAILCKNLNLKMKIFHIGAFLLSSVFVMFVTSPYTFIHYQEYITYSKRLAKDMAGIHDFTWTYQFKHTNLLFWIVNALFIINPFVFISSMWIWIVTIIKSIHRKKIDYLNILIIVGIGYSVILGFMYIKFIRYLMPLMPILYICSGIVLSRLLSYRVVFVRLVGLFGMTISVVWAVAFVSIYFTSIHPSIAASKWIYQEVPEYSVLLREYGNTFLPFKLNGNSQMKYRYIDINYYSEDNPEKIHDLAGYLEKTDYLIISSRRVYQTIMKLPEYPLTQRFYKQLFAENLGFTLVGDFYTYPQIGPIVINDDITEETFSVFDHPRVQIYKNSRTLNVNEIENQIL